MPGWIGWLARPWNGAVDHHLAPWMAWHGRAMVLSWAILVPAGLLAARFFKIWPGQRWPAELDDQHWWIAHRFLLSIAMLVSTAGLWLAWSNADGGPGIARVHAVLGWLVMALGWAQVGGGLLRGSKGGPTDPRAIDLAGDHYLMTRRRRIFERAHKSCGWLALLMTLGVIPTGLYLADAPRWMWLVILAWWLALAILARRLQEEGRAIDTYQAIWGPGPGLPGNRVRPIGWGVRRRSGEGTD